MLRRWYQVGFNLVVLTLMMAVTFGFGVNLQVQTQLQTLKHNAGNWTAVLNTNFVRAHSAVDQRAALFNPGATNLNPQRVLTYLGVENKIVNQHAVLYQRWYHTSPLLTMNHILTRLQQLQIRNLNLLAAHSDWPTIEAQLTTYLNQHGDQLFSTPLNEAWWTQFTRNWFDLNRQLLTTPAAHQLRTALTTDHWHWCGFPQFCYDATTSSSQRFILHVARGISTDSYPINRLVYEQGSATAALVIHYGTWRRGDLQLNTNIPGLKPFFNGTAPQATATGLTLDQLVLQPPATLQAHQLHLYVDNHTLSTMLGSYCSAPKQPGTLSLWRSPVYLQNDAGHHFSELQALFDHNQPGYWVVNSAVQKSPNVTNMQQTFNWIGIFLITLGWGLTFIFICFTFFFDINRAHQSIGTLKAFGVQRRQLVLAYQLILLVMMMITLVLGYVTAIPLRQLALNSFLATNLYIPLQLLADPPLLWLILGAILCVLYCCSGGLLTWRLHRTAITLMRRRAVVKIGRLGMNTKQLVRHTFMMVKHQVGFLLIDRYRFTIAMLILCFTTMIVMTNFSFMFGLWSLSSNVWAAFRHNHYMSDPPAGLMSWNNAPPGREQTNPTHYLYDHVGFKFLSNPLGVDLMQQLPRTRELEQIMASGMCDQVAFELHGNTVWFDSAAALLLLSQSRLPAGLTLADGYQPLQVTVQAWMEEFFALQSRRFLLSPHRYYFCHYLDAYFLEQLINLFNRRTVTSQQHDKFALIPRLWSNESSTQFCHHQPLRWNLPPPLLLVAPDQTRVWFGCQKYNPHFEQPLLQVQGYTALAGQTVEMTIFGVASQHWPRFVSFDGVKTPTNIFRPANNAPTPVIISLFLARQFHLGVGDQFSVKLNPAAHDGFRGQVVGIHQAESSTISGAVFMSDENLRRFYDQQPEPDFYSQIMSHRSLFANQHHRTVRVANFGLGFLLRPGVRLQTFAAAWGFFASSSEPTWPVNFLTPNLQQLNLIADKRQQSRMFVDRLLRPFYFNVAICFFMELIVVVALIYLLLAEKIRTIMVMKVLGYRNWFINWVVTGHYLWGTVGFIGVSYGLWLLLWRWIVGFLFRTLNLVITFNVSLLVFVTVFVMVVVIIGITWLTTLRLIRQIPVNQLNLQDV